MNAQFRSYRRVILRPWLALKPGHRLACALVLIGLSSSAAPAANWPQWRGPLGTGAAPQANPPTQWSETKNVKWKTPIPGRGSATPIVWGDQVFVLTAIPTGTKPPTATPAPTPADAPGLEVSGGNADSRTNRPSRGFNPASSPGGKHQFMLLCLDRSTGQPRWRAVAREEVPHEGHHRTDGTFASASPITDGERVYAFFGSRGLYCYDLAGALQWSQDLGDMKIKMSFGEGSSPALYQDTLVVTWDHEGDSFIVALDKRTGKTRWKQARDEKTSWATPLVVAHGDKPQVVAAATAKIRGYDLNDGRVLWECGGMTQNVIPTPVTADGVLYVMSGFRGSALLAIQLGRTGELTDSDAILWSHRKNTPYVPSPLLYGNKLYFLSGNNEVLSCFEAKTGKPLIDGARLEGLKGVYASPVGASDRVYVVGRNGACAVLNHQASGLEIMATNTLEEKFDASPAVADNQLFLRGREYLYCLAEK